MKTLLILLLAGAVALAEVTIDSELPAKSFIIHITGKNVLELRSEDFKKATNDHPDVELKVAFVYTETTTNTTMNKVVENSYGCLVYGCTDDHTVTFWRQQTSVLREKIAEIGGQKIRLGEEILSLSSTNFVPVNTATGMVFQATQVSPSFINPFGLK